MTGRELLPPTVSPCAGDLPERISLAMVGAESLSIEADAEGWGEECFEARSCLLPGDGDT
jgi:hypothetical protein